MKKQFLVLVLAGCLSLGFACAGLAAEETGTDFVVEFADRLYPFRSYIGEGIEGSQIFVRESTSDAWIGDSLPEIEEGAYYDIRIVGTGGEIFEYFGIPLDTVKKLSLYADGSGNYAIIEDDDGSHRMPAVEGYSEEVKMSANDTINIRSGPGTDYDKLGMLSGNREVSIYGEATGEDGQPWYMIRTGKRYGFVSGKYMVPVETDEEAGNTEETEKADSPDQPGETAAALPGQDETQTAEPENSLVKEEKVESATRPGTGYIFREYSDGTVKAEAFGEE